MVVGALDDEDVDRLFHALADATRRDILQRCVRGERSLNDYWMSEPLLRSNRQHVDEIERLYRAR